MKRVQLILSLGLTAVVILIIGGLAASWSSGIAAAGDNLPPRPTLTPPATPATEVISTESLDVRGGFIKLSAANSGLAKPELWTQVEWKSANGWQAVNGWAGHFNADAEVMWWVAAENLGEGPFRWVVYTSEGSGQMVAKSDEFYLPAHQRQVVEVRLPVPMAASTAAAVSNTRLTTKAIPGLARGGQIALTVSRNGQPQQVAPGTLWTQVQWMTADKKWQDVAGWGGHFDTNSEVVWWVSNTDLGAGPYRWIVYSDEQTKKVLAVSDPFNLPANRLSELDVDVTLP